MMIAAFFFWFTVFCLPGLPNGAETTRWGLMSVALPLLVIWRQAEIGKTCLLLLLYLLAMCCVPPIWQEAAFLYWHFLLYVACFYLFRNDMKQITIGCALGMAVNSGVVVAQNFGWQVVPQLAVPGGLFYNKNISAESAAMVLALVVGYRLWWFVPGILPSIMFGSRAALLGIGVSGFFWLWGTSRRYAVIFAVAVAAWVFTMQIGAGIYMFGSLWARAGVWLDAMHGFTLMGRGLGSFITEFPLFERHDDALIMRYENAHNDAVQLVFELGLVGAVLIGAMLWRMGKCDRSPAWYALVVFLVEGCFGFPLYKPFTGVLAACCAGVVLGGWNPVRGYLLRVGLELRDGVADRRFGVFRAGGRLIPVAPLSPYWSRHPDIAER